MGYKHIWARIDNGIVVELFFEPDDDGFEMIDRFPSSLVWVDVTAIDPRPDQGWGYSDGVFTEPLKPVTPTDVPPDVSYAVPDEAA